MIWIAMLLAVVAVVAFFLTRSGKKTVEEANAEVEKIKASGITQYNRGDSVDRAFHNLNVAKNLLFVKRLVFFVTAGLTAACFVFSCVAFVSAGVVGVQDVLGDTGHRTLASGVAIKNPFARVVEMSTRTETYTMDHRKTEGKVQGDDSIPVLTKDNLTLTTDWTIAYHLVEKAAPWVYKTFGEEYEGNIVRPKARESIKACGAVFDWEALTSTERGKYVASVLKAIQEGIDDLAKQRGYNGQVVIIDQAMLRDVIPPLGINKAIESKLQEQQDLQKMAFTLAIAEQEAKRKLIEATGIRDFQRTVVEGVTPSLLTWRWVEVMEKMAASPNKMIIIAPRDAPPIMMPAQ